MGYYLAIDPGGTVGWAKFDESTGRPVQIGEVPRGPQFFDLLREHEVGFYVVENYRIRPEFDKGKKMKSFTPKWDEALTSRDIGAIELWAYLHRREVILQEPTIKSTAAAWYGLPNDSSHQMNAVLHGAYYATKELNFAPPEPKEQRPDPPEQRVRRPARVTQISSYSGLRAARRQASVEVPKQGKET